MPGSPQVVVPEDTLLSLPFDHYERYALTRRLVSQLWPDRISPLRVLDVGGHSSSLKHFLPDDVVTLVDVQNLPKFTYRERIPFQYDHYVVAAGGTLPFADSTFDLVTAHDTLEHVPVKHRAAFVRDLLRVSRGFVILNGPMYHPLSAEAEQRLARFLEQAALGHNVSLDDHLALGLPAREDVEAVISERGLPFVSLPNGNLALWLFMMGLKHYLISLPHSDELHEETDRIYNALLAPVAIGGLCYRRAYVVASRQEDAAVLREVEAPFAQDLARRDPPFDVSTVEKIVDAMEDHSAGVRADLARLQARAVELDSALRERLLQLDEQSGRIDVIEADLTAAQMHIHNLNMNINAITGSIGWRLLKPPRAVINFLLPPGSPQRVPFRLAGRAVRYGRRRGFRALLAKGLRVLEWPGLLGETSAMPPDHLSLDEQYAIWVNRNAISQTRARQTAERAKAFAYRPKVSIVVPVYNPDPSWLKDAIDSVRAQIYDNWELCLADDCSTREGLRELMNENAAADPRIKVTFCEINGGISAASNVALALATGEFIGLLDNDDELKPDALYEVVKLLNQQPDLDFIYSDEDKRDADGRLVQPFFKPDWSPDLLLCENYVPHFAVYRRRLIEQVGGFRSQCDFSQDYDLVLRVTERTDRIAHIPLPLYTWRMIPGSAALESGAKPKAVEAAKRALSDAVQRRGLDADVLEGPHPNTYRVRYRIKDQPLISIIIPTRDRVELLRPCIASIEAKTTYPNYEIIIVDNDSTDEATLAYLEKSPHRRLPFPGPFHYAAMMNFAVHEASGEHVLLLNNDTEVITPDWIESMLEHSQRPEVAAVGARLLYPDGRPQHEGVIVGLGGGSALNADHKGYFGLGDLVLNCSAVTGACMMVRREIWERMGGFDESLGVAFNDVDYCLRARQDGYLIVYTPFAVLYHYESATRGTLHPEEDEQFFRKRWGKPGAYRDPYYNPNLSLPRPFTIRV